MMRLGCIVQISVVFWVWFVHIVFHLLWGKIDVGEFEFLVLCWLLPSHLVKRFLMDS
jgi:hypothetical protein